MFITSEVDRLARAPLHAAVISCCVLPVAQRKDLVAEVRRTVFAARGFWQSSCARGSGIRFASDSPLEGDGCEPSVPGTKEPIFVAEGELRIERGQPKMVVSYAVPMLRIHLPPAESRMRT